MKRFVTALAAALMALGAVTSSPAMAQSNDDIAALSKCVGYEACKAIQDKIDAIKRGANKIVSTVSNAVSPADDRSYFEKFTLEERQEAMAACEKNYAGRNCESGYLTPEEIAARHPQAKAPPPLSPEVARTREREQLGRLDKSVADEMDLKCFTPLMANGQNYGDCADALTQLNALEKDAKRLGLPLRASALAQQYGFPRNPDGTWNDRYARVGEPPKRASAQAEPAPVPTATNANLANPDYAALLAKCPQILGCSTEDLEMIVRGSDALRQEACGPATCSYENFKLMSQVEKELIAKGNRARAELASRSAKPPPVPTVTQQERDWCYGVNRTNDQYIAGCSALIQAGEDTATAYSNRCDGYRVARKYDEAISDCTRSIQLAPGFGPPYSHRGIAYVAKSLPDPAIADETRAIALTPDDKLAYFARGLAYALKGWNDLALADLHKVLQIDPNYQAAADWIARLSPKSVQPATAASGLNGEWLGQSSGNRVRIEVRPDGIAIYTVTENPGQGASGMVFSTSGKDRFVKQFPDGTQALITVLSSGLFHYVGPEGWSDDFKRVGPSMGSQGQPAPHSNAQPTDMVPLCVAAGTCSGH